MHTPEPPAPVLRWTGRTLRVEIVGWVDPDLPTKEADAMGRLVADQLSRQVPEAGSFTWTTRRRQPAEGPAAGVSAAG